LSNGDYQYKEGNKCEPVGDVRRNCHNNKEQASNNFYMCWYLVNY